VTTRARLTATARQDLRSIYRFIAVDRQSPEAADRQIEFLFDKFAFLAQNPLMGELRDDLRSGLRLFSAGSYVIFYRPARGGVSITRVVHGRRDWKSIF
jgi:toxin ParE1/3/4